LIGLLWAGLVAIGLARVLAHQFTPGLEAKYSGEWTRDLPLRREADRPTLVVLVHPKCPCTRASLSELDRIVARCGRKLTAYAVYLKPKGSGVDWDYTSDSPGVRAVPDEGGTIARMLGASTSGQALLFDRSGRLVFSGGITHSRGHEGDNPGRDAIVSLVLTGHAALARTPVFGCSLLDSRGTP